MAAAAKEGRRAPADPAAIRGQVPVEGDQGPKSWTHWGASAVLLGQWSLPTIGFVILGHEFGSVPDGWAVLAAPLFFLVGAVIVRPQRRLSRRHVNDYGLERLSRFLSTAFYTLLALSVLHFSIVGVPLLSISVETVRFEVGSSGFFGLPSRAVLYALPCLTLVSLATYRRQTRRITIAIWVLFAVTQLALGFKGALAEVVIISAIGYFARDTRLRPRQLGAFAFAGTTAILYVQFIAQRYQTLAHGPTGLAYVFTRATTDAITAGRTALISPPPQLDPHQSVFVHDLSVLISRYFHIGTGGYAFDELVSALVTGTWIQPGAFLVPVTVGGPIYLLKSVPLMIALVAMVGLGAAWVSAVRSLHHAWSPTRLATAAVAVYSIRLFLMNGNGAYIVINMGLTLVILWTCWLISTLRGTRSLAYEVDIDHRTLPRR